MKKICLITTVPFTMNAFVVETAKYLHNTCNYDVTLICTDDEEFANSLPEYIHYIPVHMSRGVDFSGLASVWNFYKVFKREKFDLIQYTTMNASCYASIASFFARIPIRIYAQWGIRYITFEGLSRKFFKSIEKMICHLSTHVRIVSPMNLQFAIDEGLCKKEKAKVVGNGGTIGVDMSAYDISKKEEWKKLIRDKYNISNDDFVFGFAGRVTTDKGCTELLTAYKNISETYKNTKLLIVGPMEDMQGVPQELVSWANSSESVVFTGKADNKDMRLFYSAMDILVHPTYREGFGMVIQESGALAVPVITTKIPGASEVMVDGESCALVEVKNTQELQSVMTDLLCNKEKAKMLGEGAYKRTKALYDRPIMLENQRKEYERLLK